MRQDRARTSLDCHATCIVAAYGAGAAGKTDGTKQNIRSRRVRRRFPYRCFALSRISPLRGCGSSHSGDL
jgi:hypothetical protein